jgi:hypothetical protein
MFEAVTAALVGYHLGDWASVVGLVVAIVGFGVTLAKVTRSKQAAEQAERAVNRMRGLLDQTNAINEFAAAVVIMDEIKRLHHHGITTTATVEDLDSIDSRYGEKAVVPRS